MTIQRFCVKFFARPDKTLDDALFIDIFHEWIRLQKLPGVLLDVADYRHVPDGPGVMLITHEINFSMDYTEGGFGLLAQRKRGQGETHQERLLELLRATLTFGALLESDPRVEGKLHLEGGSFIYLSNDRLLAPNSSETFNTLRPDLEAAAKVLYPDREISVAQVINDPRNRLAIAVEADSVDIRELAEAMGVLS